MPGDYKEEIINNLVTKFSIDRTAVEEVVSETQKLLKKQRDVAKEEMTFQDKDYHASLDMRREAIIESLANQEEIIKKHFAARLEMAKNNAEEEKRIAKELAEDLQKIQDRKKEATEEVKKDHQLSMQMGEEQKGLLRALGFSDFMGFVGAMAGPMAALTFLGGSLYQAHDRIREARIEGTRLAVSMGMEPEAGMAIGQSLLELPRLKGASKEDVTSVVRAFAPIAATGAATPGSIGRLAGEAFDVSTVTGVAPADAARLMTNFRVLEDVPFERLKNSFLGIDYAAKEAGITTSTFVGWLNTAIDSGKLYNISIDESKNLLLRYSSELREGTLTVQQLTTAQKAVGTSPEGFRAMMGQRIAEAGGPVAQYLESIGATSAMGRATAIRAIGEGMLVSPTTGELYKPEEGSKDADRLNMYRQMVEKSYAEYITGMARKFSDSPGEYAGFLEKFGAMAGIRGDTLFGTQEMTKALAFDATRGVTRPGEEMLEAAKQSLSAAEKTLEAANIQYENQTQMRRFLNAYQRGMEATWLSWGTTYWKLVGNEENAKAWQEAFDKVGRDFDLQRTQAGIYRGRQEQLKARERGAIDVGAFQDVWGENPLFKVELYNTTSNSLGAKARESNVKTSVIPGTVEKGAR